MNEIWLLAQATAWPVDRVIFTAIAGCASGVVGGFVGFFLGLAKSRAEIANLKAQAVKNAGDFLINSQKARRQYVDDCKECGLIVAEIIHLLDGDSKVALDEARERFCASLNNHVIPGYIDDMEWRYLDLKDGSPDGLDELLKDGIAELERFHKWLNVVNHEKLLTHLGKRPYGITARTFRPVEAIVSKFPSLIRNDCNYRLGQITQRLCGK